MKIKKMKRTKLSENLLNFALKWHAHYPTQLPYFLLTSVTVPIRNPSEKKTLRGTASACFSALSSMLTTPARKFMFELKINFKFTTVLCSSARSFRRVFSLQLWTCLRALTIRQEPSFECVTISCKVPREGEGRRWRRIIHSYGVNTIQCGCKL